MFSVLFLPRRLSTLTAGLVLLVLVSIGTFNWASIRHLRQHPSSSSIVMVATVVVTVATHDLAKGVLTGVLLSGVFFAQKVSRMLDVGSRLDEEGALDKIVLKFRRAGTLVDKFGVHDKQDGDVMLSGN